MKKFNVTGICIPEKHYMVNIQGKLDQIIELIEDDQYFTINRARQYGKTTTFSLLDRQLSEQYYIIRMSFEGVSEESFADNPSFVRMFHLRFQEEMAYRCMPKNLVDNWNNFDGLPDKNIGDPFDFLSRKISELCRNSDREMILMIDEVDKSADNQVFLNFLGMLREKYLRSREGLDNRQCTAGRESAVENSKYTV